MNIESMRTRSYRSFKVDDAELPAAARERLLAIRRFDELRKAGCREQAALKEIGVSRRTMFRWKAALAAGGQRGLAPKSTRPHRVRRPSRRPGDVKAVMDLRRKHPFMGKAPIQRMLERKGLRLSVSAVGRILSRAIAVGHVPRASACEGRLEPKRRRRFNGWARRWRYGARPTRPGQLVQIDHMTFSRDGRTIKEFRAVCPVSRFMVARVFSRATALNARRFLDEVVKAFPVALQSIQVDGGSEFMAEFEDACEKLGIELHVLPPRRPQWNGCVERANRTARIEFWNFLDCELTVQAVSAKLLLYEFFYNYERPHSSLDYLTPNEYLVAQEAA